jgi:ribonuclease P protein component
VSEAFDKSCRLLDKADFAKVFSQGIKSHGKYFLLIVTSNDLEHARLGIAVSRKVSTRAVIRNRIKRQIRESFRTNKNILKGLDCVVIARNSAASTEKPVLRTSLDNHWQKISDNA